MSTPNELSDFLAVEDFRLRELERRAPILDEPTGGEACEGAIKLYNDGGLTTTANVVNRIPWTGSLYACTASPHVSGGITFEQQSGVWHITGEIAAIPSVTTDITLELWTDKGTQDNVLSYDRQRDVTSSDLATLHVSTDDFFVYGESVWLAVYATDAAATLLIASHPALQLCAHLVDCMCVGQCNWTETCSGWDITC